MANVQHKVLATTNLHNPGYWGSTDPGAVGAGIYWVDTSQGFPYYVVKVRNQSNTAWDTIVANVLSDGQVNIVTAAQAYSHIINDARDAGPKLWHHKLDDTSTALDKLWSANKVNAHATTAAIHRSINDGGSSATDLWSAAKIIAQLATKQPNVADGQLVPTGAILAYGGRYAHPGYLLCDGSVVSRETYVDLYVAIGTYWGYGNGSTTFNVPDLRGRFLRMGSYGIGRDPDVGSRTPCNLGGAGGAAIGSVQGHAFAYHVHYLQRPVWHGSANNGDSTQWGWSSAADVTSWGMGYDTDTRGQSSETRPINANVTFEIKY